MIVAALFASRLVFEIGSQRFRLPRLSQKKGMKMEQRPTQYGVMVKKESFSSSGIRIPCRSREKETTFRRSEDN